MKRLILSILISFLVLFVFGQNTPVKVVRIENATTAFGSNLSVGDQVYNISSGELWVAKTGVIGTATLTTASASFNRVNGGIPAVTSSTTGQLTVTNGTTSPALSIVTGPVTSNGTSLATGGQVYNFVTGQGFLNSETDPSVKAINGLVKSNGTAVSAAVAGTDYLAPNGSAALLNNFPTLNQNTTGNAATATTANTVVTNANMTGDVTSIGNTTTIAPKAVTLSKMNDMASGSLIYRKSASAGAPEVQTLATLKTDLGLSGTNTGDQILPTLVSLGAVAGNAAITGGTNTKITYDSKGLVTGGAAATTADIAASANKNYVTDAQQVILNNTSGINTGDNAPNSLYSGLISNATHTGDVSGSTVLTLATVNSNVGSFNNLTVNAKGLVTGASNVAYLTNETDPSVKAINGLVKSNGTAVSAAVAGTDYLAPNGSAASLTNFPTLNQNTTGNAATATTATTATNFSGSLTGDVSGTQGATVVGKINGTSLSTLATGILKNTTATGIPSIAVAGTDYQLPLVSGTSIKTINSTSLLGSGDITIAPNATHTGDVTGSGALTIAPNAVTYSKMQTVTASRLLGNPTAGAAVPSEITVGSGLSLSTGGVLTATGTGTVTAVSVASANGLTGTSSGGATPALTLGTSVTGLMKGNGTGISAAVAGTDYLAPNGSAALLTNFPTLNQNTTGNAATVTTNANMTGDVTSVGNVTSIAANAVSNTDLNTVATATLKGRATAGTGNVEDLTAAQVRTLLNVADGANNYVHPSGDGNLHVPATSTTNNGKVLTAGATAGSLSWTTPTTGTVTTASVVSANGISGTVATATTTPAITLTLGAITPTSVTATGAVSGTQLTSTVATGTAPLVVTSTTPVANLNIGGNAATATTATNATNSAITNDVATATPVYPTWVTTTTGNLPAKVSSTKLSFVPSTGILTATGFVGSLNGNATTATTASTVTTNANLTGEVTSVGNAATLSNAAVIGKVLTGYTSGAGTITATDNILQAIQKLNGNAVAGAGWKLTGNAGTTAGTNFIGTTDDIDVVFKRNGVQAGLLNTTNTSFGSYALNPSTTGNNNVAIGAYALYSNTTGNNNTATGKFALNANTTGNLNIATGHSALSYNTTGSYNIAIGYQAGYGDDSQNQQTTVDNYATFIGYQASRNGVPSTTPLTNITAIGYNAKVSQNNSIILGGTGADAVKVGIGTSAPGLTLDVIGNGRFSTGVSAFSEEEYAVSGTSNYGIGLYGYSKYYAGIHGLGDVQGIIAESPNGTALIANSTGTGNPLHLNGVKTGAITDELLTIASDGIVKKIPFSSISSAHTLDAHSNVAITAISAGEILKWNGTTWVNNTLAEAGIQPAGSYLTANQSISFAPAAGDVTGSTSGSTSLAPVLTIGNNKVTYAKMQTVTASRLLGNPTASAAVPSEITVGSGLNLSTGGVLTATGGSGTVTAASVVSANGISGTVANATTTPAITLSLGAITPTSVAATGAVSGTQLTSTVATGTAPLVVTSTTPVANLSIGGNAATATTANTATNFSGNLAGDVTGTQGATVVGKINGTSLSALSTGILKNTTATGIPSIAVAGTDYQLPLVSGTSIKTINSTSLLGSGDIAITPNATHTGDVTGSGALTIAPNAVTYAKMQTVTASRLLGNPTAGAAVPSEITVGSGLSLSTGGVLTATGGTGTVTSASVVTANGISGSVATATTTPAITLTLGAITPASVAATGGVSGTQLTSTVVTGTAPLVVTSTTPVANLSIGGNAATATTATTATNATNATNTAITNDVATATAVYPTWVTANTGNLPAKVSSTTLSFVPSTGVVTAGGFVKSGGTASQFLKANGTVDANTYLTANQSISFTPAAGDVTGSSTGTTSLTPTLTIAPNAVTYGKMQTVTASRLLGNPTAGAAVPSEITVGSGLSLSTGGVLTATGTGTVTAVSVASANGLTGTSSGGATPALTLGTSVTGLMKGNGTGISAAVAGTDYLAPNGSAALLTNFPTLNQNTTGNAATVTTNANMTGDVTSVGNVTSIAANAVSNADLNTVATATLKGRATAGTGNVEDLTAAQVRTLLNVADGANNYVHPSGDGNLHVPATSTTNNGKVLTAGATAGSLSWVTPSSGTVTSASVVTANGISGTVATATTTPAITLTLGAITPTSMAATGAVSGTQLTSTIATGTAPLVVTSTTPVANLSIGGNAATATTATNFSGSLTGDISGTQGATTIGANKVTYAKMQTVTASRLLGNPTAGAAVPSEITVGSGLNLSTGGVLTATGGSGTVTSTSVVTANGISGTVATATTTPAITLTLGAITPTSVAATSTVSGTQLTSTVATGTAPLVVTSTTPVANLSIGGNAATATTATTATNANNTAVTNDVATATPVYPTWVTANTGNMPTKVSSTTLSFVPSTGVVTAGGFVKSGGTSAQFLKADGSVDATSYLVREVADEFTATAAQTSFTMTQTPSVNSKVKMYINGVRISNTAYSKSGTTLTYIPANNGGYALVSGDRIQLDYYY